MKWPPNQKWTSAKIKKGYRHFEIKNFGGKGDGRWVELFPILNKVVSFRVKFSELKNKKEWESGWVQLEDNKD